MTTMRPGPRLRFAGPMKPLLADPSSNSIKWTPIPTLTFDPKRSMGLQRVMIQSRFGRIGVVKPANRIIDHFLFKRNVDCLQQ